MQLDTWGGSKLPSEWDFFFFFFTLRDACEAGSRHLIWSDANFARRPKFVLCFSNMFPSSEESVGSNDHPWDQSTVMQEKESGSHLRWWCLQWEASELSFPCLLHKTSHRYQMKVSQLWPRCPSICPKTSHLRCVLGQLYPHLIHCLS